VYFRQAAADLPEAKFLVGVALLEGQGCERDAAGGTQWLQLAAEEDYPPAQARLGKCYQDGVGVSGPDPAAALAWLRRAVKNGDPEGLYHLALCYREGYGRLRQNNVKAKKLLRRAARKGHLGARALLKRLGSD
jgi:TPR repeat protein